MKLKALSCGVLLGLLSTSALANDFSVNVGAISVMPDDSSSNLNVVETVAGLPENSTGVGVNTNTQLGLTFDYALTNNWTVELVAATPFSHDITATGALAGLKVGKTKHLPPTLLAQYHFDLNNDMFKPFIGVGVNYTAFFDEQIDPQLRSTLGDLGVVTADDSVSLALKNSWGYALQAGVNVELTKDWGLHFMVSRMDIDTTGDVRVNDTTIQSVDVDIDPYVAMAGIRYSF
ncbi:OmpW/AlkL family protein [Idiomarina abyssalis]|uniref:Outer membrane beta-barrel protein n=1 Tax=Idiomarina abyssalis TaxID=86102 RepID=A0A8I1KEX2_9GAMM|nr:OmpW family outer membrane protein [Idiomarina abyssalis]KPD21852.1 membrane protein [Idiomarina abyssalis]MBJ7266242.1 outer membrane beta-barrel protein [Idiomarina abyssalis]MBJ7272701.1 outer membrane beta-barrel protein [Idiomarina abyssalis]MBJ7316381.1 outer membrane beta-barrel protein [Idiomarina abyssalis]SFT66994.1 outer membrane protein [Idiomarina abyssalis]